jgi:hypothetical protein
MGERVCWAAAGPSVRINVLRSFSDPELQGFSVMMGGGGKESSKGLSLNENTPRV